MRITCVHQGVELYGSDRSFVESVRIIRSAYPDAAIVVVLPRHGPIVAHLADLATQIVIEPLWILRRRDLRRLATVGLLALPGAVFRAWRRLAGSDLVYVNTSVVADYLLAARLRTGRTLLHVHEIPQGATLTVLRALVRWSGADVIFNSHATERAFRLPASVKSSVVYNGIAGPSAPEPKTYDGGRPLRVLMLGRISRIKGQEVLVEAIRRLPSAIRARLSVRIVGSAYADAAREEALAAAIAEAGLAQTVTLQPFVDDPAELYRWADIVAVPSRLPESLGRVAIEAMSYGRPPLATRIGGLAEVVEAGRSGWLVEPDDAAGLCAQIAGIVTSPEAWDAFPASARARYEAVFDDRAAARGITAMMRALTGRSAAGATGRPRVAVEPR